MESSNTLAKIFTENKSKILQGTALATGLGLSAYALYKLYGGESVSTPVKMLEDASFTKNQLSYSEECNKRAEQLSNVSYRLLLTLSAEEN